MNNSYSLKEGDKLTICYREREFYTSAIQEVKDNGIITTYAPMDAKALLNEITEDKRQDIIKFIFNQQQRSRAKGLRS